VSRRSRRSCAGAMRRSTKSKDRAVGDDVLADLKARRPLPKPAPR